MEFRLIKPRVKLLPCGLGVAPLPLLSVCHTDYTVMFVMILPFNTTLLVFEIPQASHGIRNVLKQTGSTSFLSNGELTKPLFTNVSILGLEMTRTLRKHRDDSF